MKRNVLMSGLLRKAFIAIALAGLTPLTGASLALAGQGIETNAKQAIILDYDTGTVLFEKSADQLMAPSSMSKLMTVYMVFGKLKDGSWTMSDQLPVSETAWKKHYKTDESLMFLPVGTTASVESLLKGVVIQSGNDACSVLAEAISGSEEAFAEAETNMARTLGMTNSTFKNASGTPDPEHLMTARDLAILSTHIIRDFPEQYSLFSEKSFVYNNIKQDNRNPLLWTTQGADGLKTGHTDAGGYGVTASVKRGDRRLIMVLNGMGSLKERWEESQRVIEWAFREFENYPVFRGEELVGEADVMMGAQAKVALKAGTHFIATLPRSTRQDLKVVAVYDNPVAAPVAKDQVIGHLVITAHGIAMGQIPLLAAVDVERLGFWGRLGKALHQLFSGS
jgi:serine-type D-Ala-D-Ala carboxypeptidase (penicillin-binding protein 5/6)